MNSIDAKKILSLYQDLSLTDRLHIYIRLRRLPFEIVESYVPKNGKILDFGCGHGFFSLYLALKSKAREVLGVDISKEKIKNALKSKHSNKVKFSYDPKSFLFLNKKKYYDAVAILNVLYLLKKEDQVDLIKRASMSLTKNGRLLLIEPDASLKLRTFYEIIRESIMLKLFKLTEGVTLTYNTKQWWVNNLKKYFGEVKCLGLGKKKHHLLYIAKNKS